MDYLKKIFSLINEIYPILFYFVLYRMRAYVHSLY